MNARPDVSAPPVAPALVSITGVSRRYGEVIALDDVSIDIRANEFFALLGPSGCGKTTLLRILAGLDDPDAGTVTLDGADLVAMPAHRRPINLMFQSFALFPHLDVQRNVAYGLERERRPRAEIRDRVDEALETVGLGGLHRRRISQLSGGQRQRVALARAIVKRPRLLLLDEPLGALDKQIRTQMQIELKRLQHEVGITFVVVTHDQEEAMSMADRIAVLRDGRVEQVGSPSALYEQPSTRFVAEFIGSTNMFEPGELGSEVRTAVSIRPERMTVTRRSIDGAGPGGDPSDQTDGDPDGTVDGTLGGTVDGSLDGTLGGSLDGTVVAVQFYGGISHVHVAVEGRSRPLVVAVVGSTDLVRAEPVRVEWDPIHAIEVHR